MEPCGTQSYAICQTWHLKFVQTGICLVGKSSLSSKTIRLHLPVAAYKGGRNEQLCQMLWKYPGTPRVMNNRYLWRGAVCETLHAD